MSRLTETQIAQAIYDGSKALKDNPQMDYALVYPDGFVPNSYKWPAPAARVRVNRDGSHSLQGYDRKRSRAKGSYITLWRDECYKN